MNIRNKRWLSVFTLLICGMLVATGIEAKKPDGVKPDNPNKVKAELIAFTGALVGWEEVEGCCPNAGPDPEYQMTLPDGLSDSDGIEVYPADTYNGFLFMNSWSFEEESGYLVQFWASRDEDEEPLTFEIICGTTVYDRKTRVLRVSCDEQPWWNHYDRNIDMGPVSFEILRVPTRYCTDDVCTP